MIIIKGERWMVNSMKDNKPGFKLKVKCDITESANKTLDNINEKVNHAVKPIGTIIDYIDNVFLYRLKVSSMVNNYNLEQLKSELQSKYNDIPDERKCDPKLNIVGPVIDSLKYNLDEEYIRDMFINILISSFDSDTRDDVLPAFIKIVEQLSINDALFLVQLKQIMDSNQLSNFGLLELIDARSGGLYSVLDSFLVYENNGIVSHLKLDEVVIDNLVRLRLIKIEKDRIAHPESVYSTSFDVIKKGKYSTKGKLSCHKFGFAVTAFGNQFLNICIKN